MAQKKDLNECQQSLEALNTRYDQYLNSLPQKQREYHQLVLNATNSANYPLRTLSAPLLLAKQQQMFIQNQNRLSTPPVPPVRPQVIWQSVLNQSQVQTSAAQPINAYQRAVAQHNRLTFATPTGQQYNRQFPMATPVTHHVTNSGQTMMTFTRPPPPPLVTQPMRPLASQPSVRQPSVRQPSVRQPSGEELRTKRISEMISKEKPINLFKLSQIERKLAFGQNNYTSGRRAPPEMSSVQSMNRQYPVRPLPAKVNIRSSVGSAFRPLPPRPSVAPQSQTNLLKWHLMNTKPNDVTRQQQCAHWIPRTQPPIVHQSEPAVEDDVIFLAEVIRKRDSSHLIRRPSDPPVKREPEEEEWEPPKKLVIVEQLDWKEELNNLSEREFNERALLLVNELCKRKTRETQETIVEVTCESQPKVTVTEIANHVTLNENDFTVCLDLIKSRDLRRKPMAYLNAKYPRNDISRAIYAGVATKQAVMDFSAKKWSAADDEDKSGHRLSLWCGRRVEETGRDRWPYVLANLDVSSPLSQKVVAVLPEFRFKGVFN